MLRALNIRNFALVSALDIELGPGLTVITGESGAGKSILLDALSLVLGARARRSQVRPGAEACDVSAEFDLGQRPELQQTLAELDMLDVDAGACLVRRTAGERSRAFVNGTPTTLAVLQSLTEPLIDIHGQYEHRQLLGHSAQRRLLDEFGVPRELVDAVAAAHAKRTRLGEELARRRAAQQQREERKSLLTYQIEELEALGDAVNRVEELTATHKRLSRAQELLAAMGGAMTELEDAIGRVSRLANLIEGVEDPQPNLASAAELSGTALAHLEETEIELRRYIDSFPEDDSELAEIDATLASVHDMARKHRVPAPALAVRLKEARQELAAAAEEDTRLEALAAQSAAADTHFQAAAAELSRARRAAAAPFGEAVTGTLAELGLKNASLAVEFAPAESAAGLETVEFRLRANPGFPAGSLSDIASGGELSRIALAIQVVAAARSRLPCLVLDEADIGVGGTSADVLGRLLRRLARHTQVIAITHAPQIAALGDAHLQVIKTGESETSIRVLDGAERTEELARMLGGRRITEETREYARTLLAGAGEDGEEGETEAT